jgi:antitoxin (DNA-binding transcriptional repressor) of toxin-antitoxin stability system
MRSATVGARALKTRLGTYLRLVREGQRIVVTERGRPVAELRALSQDGTGRGARLLRLQVAGLVSAPTRRSLAPLRAVRGRGSALAQAIVEDREDRF